MSSQQIGEREPLTSRERLVLRSVVHQFVLTANPVGSHTLVAGGVLGGLSAASIRAILNRLEATGYLTHPHTSAGRVPTDLGYRVYVDSLMEVGPISPAEAAIIGREVGGADREELLGEASRLLGRISNQLAVIVAPRLGGIFEQLQLVELSSTRLLVVLTLRAGPIRTVLLDAPHRDLGSVRLDGLAALLNARLAGLSLAELRDGALGQRLADHLDDGTPETGLLRVLLRHTNQLFADGATAVHIGGAPGLLGQPEFADRPGALRGLLEWLEERRHVAELFAAPVGLHRGGVSIRIGAEAVDASGPGQAWSVMSATYRVGETVGTVGLIGPTRMDYARLTGLLGCMSATLSRTLSRANS